MIACSLLLCADSAGVWAAARQASVKPGKQSVKASSGVRPRAPGASKSGKRNAQAEAFGQDAEVGIADVLDADGRGLHGQASFYGRGFQGRKTSTGERFDVRQFTAASNHFPLGSQVAVRRLDDARCVIVKVNDRMHSRHRRRVIDVSRSAAEYLGMLRAGVVMVRVAALKKTEGAAEDCQSAFDPLPDCVGCNPSVDADPFLLKP